MKFDQILLNSKIREQFPGKFITLSDGVVHYELEGKTSDPTIVLVHGFSVPYFAWDFTFPELVKNGFRVLRYDLYGRGYSDRPKRKYNSDLFDKQLMELLTQLKLLDKKITLIGLSMGGAIVTTFIDRHSDLVERLILVDPAGFPMPMPSATGLLKIPILNKAFFRLIGNKIILGGVLKNFYHPERFTEYYHQFKEQMQYKGFRNAIFSTLRHMPLNNLQETYHRVGEKAKIPMLLFWGKEDQTIPYYVSDQIRSILSGILFYTIENCGHMPQYECPEEFNARLLLFLKKGE